MNKEQAINQLRRNFKCEKARGTNPIWFKKDKIYYCKYSLDKEHKDIWAYEWIWEWNGEWGLNDDSFDLNSDFTKIIVKVYGENK